MNVRVGCLNLYSKLGTIVTNNIVTDNIATIVAMQSNSVF